VPILSGSLLRIPLGIATGVVGAIGGVGGFFLPTLLGNLKQSFGSFASGFVVLACIALAAALALRMLVAIQHGWKFSAERASSRCITTTGGAC
jgi:NNP family nitrate/nitrite transporter-like MFS transporter